MQVVNTYIEFVERDDNLHVNAKMQLTVVPVVHHDPVGTPHAQYLTAPLPFEYGGKWCPVLFYKDTCC
jgi:hypothetical protein